MRPLIIIVSLIFNIALISTKYIQAGVDSNEKCMKP